MIELKIKSFEKYVLKNVGKTEK